SQYILGFDVVGDRIADEDRVWICLLRYVCRAACWSLRTAAIMARRTGEFVGHHSRLGHLRSGDRMDGVDSRSRLHYTRKLYQLADVVFHAAVWPVLAPRTGV